jgi:hypothetical protein
MSRTETAVGYQKLDIEQAHRMFTLHLAKMAKSISTENYAETCTAVRAIQDECDNALRVAGVLSFKARNNEPAARIPRAAP